jgi:hypothetical protein
MSPGNHIVVVALRQAEETMQRADKSLADRGGASLPVEQTKEPNHTEKIASQVLAKIGIPPRFDRVEVCRHHHGKYRVNIWQQFEANKSIAVTPSSRVGLSYYLTVS